MALNKVLKVTSNSELLSFIINQNPVLSSEIDLPKQGESVIELGKLIMNNERYKNAFINTVNLIGLTIIKKNGWDNPWDFTLRGTLNYGQQIREIINDLCNVYDYNDPDVNTETRFLESVVPNVFNYIHEVNFQKFYETSTSDAQMAMAFATEGGLLEYIVDAISMLYESYKYDTYIVDKYMLCRRILDGTVTPTQISNYANLTPRQRVSAIKSVSNKMAFRSPNYNPAGIRRATSFDDQILIVNTEFEADFSTEVLATSFFRDEADMKARLVLIDGFDNHDTTRLSELLGDAYVEFTEAELTALANIPAVLIAKEWFMDYDYALDTESAGGKQTNFYNPTTLKNNHYLHVWRVFSTSPFENATVYGTETPAVSSVTITPSEATISAGQSLQLHGEAVTTGFANKAVTYSVQLGDGVTVDLNGKVTIPADFNVATGEDPQPNVTIRATSVYDTTKYADASITVV